MNIKQPMEYSCKSWFGWQQAKKWCSWLKDKGKYWHHSFWGMTPNKLKRLYQQQAATIAQPRQGIKLVAQPTTGPKLLWTIHTFAAKTASSLRHQYHIDSKVAE